MSVMSSQKRKIAKKYKDRLAVIRAALKPEEFLKHRVHAKQIIRACNEERAREEHKRLLSQTQ